VLGRRASLGGCRDPLLRRGLRASLRSGRLARRGGRPAWALECVVACGLSRASTQARRSGGRQTRPSGAGRGPYRNQAGGREPTDNWELRLLADRRSATLQVGNRQGMTDGKDHAGAA
jgi:hypothetical protein